MVSATVVVVLVVVVVAAVVVVSPAVVEVVAASSPPPHAATIRARARSGPVARRITGQTLASGESFRVGRELPDGERFDVADLFQADTGHVRRSRQLASGSDRGALGVERPFEEGRCR